MATAELTTPLLDTAPSKAKAASKRPIILGVIALGVATAGISYYLHSRHYEETDDAQVDADITAISPRITGTVIRVNFADNQKIAAGDVIAEIDPADYEVAVAQAKANLAQMEALLRVEMPTVSMTETTNATSLATSSSDVGTSQADIAQAQAQQRQADANLTQSQANDKLATTELERTKKLVASGTISSAELDTRVAQADVTRAATLAAQQAQAAAREHVNQTRAKLGASTSRVSEVKNNGPRQLEAQKASVDVRQANVDLAQAQLHQAELNLGYTKIIAPVAGVIGKKSVNVGDRVQPGQQLMALTHTNGVWVTANFRETQLRTIRAGQPVEIHVDALDAVLQGHVETIAGATGARYSLLPPENATGNYVKVVQRVPVRIAFEPNQPGVDQLRPGLSVVPEIKVR